MGCSSVPASGPHPLNTPYFKLNFDADACDCAVVLPASREQYPAEGLAPGSHICLDGSERPQRGPLRITGLAGTREAPIVIRNCMAPVSLHAWDHRPPLYLEGSYFRVSGTGASNTTHGLILRTNTASQAISVSGPSHHFEIDHVSIEASEFAGIMAKQDPSSSDCRVGDRRYDAYAMVHVHIHHNRIRNVKGEGIYVGNSFYNGAEDQYCQGNPDCNASPCGNIQYPHEVRQVYVWKNEIENTAWDAIQIGSAVDHCYIHQNNILAWGTQNINGQNHGIQVGSGSSCQVSYNTLKQGPMGMQIAGLGNTTVFANEISQFAISGIYINPSPSVLFTDPGSGGYLGGFEIFENTLISAFNTGAAIRDVRRANMTPPQPNILRHNRIETENQAYQLSEEYQWQVID